MEGGRGGGRGREVEWEGEGRASEGEEGGEKEAAGGQVSGGRCGSGVRSREAAGSLRLPPRRPTLEPPCCRCVRCPPPLPRTPAARAAACVGGTAGGREEGCVPTGARVRTNLRHQELSLPLWSSRAPPPIPAVLYPLSRHPTPTYPPPHPSLPYPALDRNPHGRSWTSRGLRRRRPRGASFSERSTRPG